VEGQKMKKTDDRRYIAAKHYVEQGQPRNGYKKSLLFAGYTKGTVQCYGKRMFHQPDTQVLIKKCQQEYDTEHGYNKEKATKLLKELKKECEDAKDRTNKLGCIKELDRIHGLYGDEDASININQVIVTPQERKKVLLKELKQLEDIEAAPLCIAE
jgi:hypothetical protein